MHDALIRALKGYERVVDQSLDALYYFSPIDEESAGEHRLDRPRPALLTMTYYKNPDVFDPNTNFDSSTVTSKLYINSTDLGPMQPGPDRKQLLRRIVEMTLSFRLVSIELVALRRSCLIWQINLVFSFKTRAQMSLKLHEEIIRDCDDTTSTQDLFRLGDLLWLNLVLIFFSFAFCAAVVKLKYECFMQFLRSQNERGQIESSTTFQRTMIFFHRFLSVIDFWFVSEVLCVLCIIMSSLLNLATNSARRPTAPFHNTMVGLGVGLLWINIVSYFGSRPTYYAALILTLERSVPRVLRFLLGVAPLFMGYALFGVAFYGASTVRFDTLAHAFVSLFSLVNGDSIGEVFRDLLPIHSIVTQFYLYSFILIGTFVVLNILIAIVEEAFFVSMWKYESKQALMMNAMVNGGGGHAPLRTVSSTGFNGHVREDNTDDESAGGADNASESGAELKALERARWYRGSSGGVGYDVPTKAFELSGSSAAGFTSVPVPPPPPTMTRLTSNGRDAAAPTVPSTSDDVASQAPLLSGSS